MRKFILNYKSINRIITIISVILALSICVSAVSYDHHYFYNKNPESTVGGFSVSGISNLQDSDGHNIVNSIKTYGCFVTSYAMVLRTMGATTSSLRYDNRTGNSGYLQADPFTVTLANLYFPTTTGNTLNYSNGEYIEPVNINSPADLVGYFGLIASTVNLSGLSESSKKCNIDRYIDTYPQGIILRFSKVNDEGWTENHTVVLIESNYNTNSRGTEVLMPEVYDDSPLTNAHVWPTVMPRYTPDSGYIKSTNNGDDFIVYDPAYYGTSSDGALALSDTWLSQEYGWSNLVEIKIVKEQ